MASVVGTSTRGERQLRLSNKSMLLAVLPMILLGSIPTGSKMLPSTTMLLEDRGWWVLRPLPFETTSPSTSASPGFVDNGRKQWGIDTLKQISSGSWDPIQVLQEVHDWGGSLRPPKRDGKLPGVGDPGVPGQVQQILRVAHAQIGKPYVWGGESPGEGGFDCSGLLDYAFRQAGIDLPGRLTTQSALHLGQSVKGRPLRAGDFVITNGGKHMVMYVGGGKVIASPHTGSVVQYQPFSRFKGDIVDIRRIL